MTQRLTADLWRCIFDHIDRIDDVRSFSKVDRAANVFVTKHLQIVSLRLAMPYPTSMRFLTCLRGMRTLSIDRVYNTALDIHVLQKCVGLKTLYLNSFHKVVGIPSHVILTVKSPQTRLKSTFNGLGKTESTKMNAIDQLVTPKEYFMSRYANRFGKYGSKRCNFSV